MTVSAFRATIIPATRCRLPLDSVIAPGSIIAVLSFAAPGSHWLGVEQPGAQCTAHAVCRVLPAAVGLCF